MNTQQLTINNLSLAYVQRLEPNVKRIRLLYNRIKHFDRQLSLHYSELKFYPSKPLKEIKRLRKMYSQLHLYDLINTNIKIQTIKKEINQWPIIKEHWKISTGLDWITKKSKLTDVERIYLNKLELNAQKAKKQEHVWRINIALEIALKNNWYIIFNTLTVNPERRNYVFQRNSKAFAEYIKLFDKISTKENHQYYGVVEYGSSTGREHYHTLHMLKEIPETWKKDPNLASIHATKREIDQVKSLWKYGYSSPIAVRTDITDAWAQLGFRWPVTLLNGQIVANKSGSASKLANYVSKYITKSQLQKEYKQCKPKIRQQLGMQIINQSLQKMTVSQLNLMLELSRMKVLTIHYKMIPSQLLISATHRYVVKLLQKDNKHIQLMSLTPRPSLMSVLRDSMRMITVRKSLKIISSPISSFKRQELFNIQKIIDYTTVQLTGFLEYPETKAIQGSHASQR